MSTTTAELRDIRGKVVPTEAFDGDGCGLKGSAYHTNWPLLFMLFMLPLQNIQVNYLPILPGGLNFLNVAFLLSLLGMQRVDGTLANYRGLNGWVAAYVLWGFLTLYFGYATVGTQTEEHFNAYKDQAIGILIFFVVQRSVRDWVGLRRIALATLLPLGYTARVVKAQHASVSSWHYDDDLRISGTFTHLGANEMAAFAVTVVAICVGLLFALKKNRVWWPVLIVGVAAAGMSIAYGYSRTSYVAVIVAVAAVYIFNRRKGRYLIPMALAVIVTLSVLPQSVIDRFDMLSDESTEQDESTQSRYVFWALGIERWKTSPVLGIGYHTFHHPEHSPYGKDTHNYYVLMLVERGVIGAIIFLVMVGKMWTVTRSIYKRKDLPRWGEGVALATTGALIGMMVGNTFGDRFSHYPMIAILWTWLALTIKVPDLIAESKRRAGEPETSRAASTV